jgi:hypothetical protein
MVKSIKKTKMKKYKSKKKDRKRKTMKKKMLTRRTFKKKVKKQRGGAELMDNHLTGKASTSALPQGLSEPSTPAQTSMTDVENTSGLSASSAPSQTSMTGVENTSEPSTPAQTRDYRAFEEFFYEDNWEEPNSPHTTIAHITKVYLDIAHDFNKSLPADYGKTCIELIEEYKGVGYNNKYYDLLNEWKDSSKTIRERFLLLYSLSILDPTLLESALSIFKIKIDEANTSQVTPLKGQESELFLQNLYFITDAFGSSTVFEALIKNIEGNPNEIPRQPITGVNKNYSNIFDPASLAQAENFLEIILLDPNRGDGVPTPALSPVSLSEVSVDGDVFKLFLQESTQLFFDSVVKFGTQTDYEIIIEEIMHPAIVLRINDVHYVHIHGDNSISAMIQGESPDLDGYKKTALQTIKSDYPEVKRLYDFFVSTFITEENKNLKYSYKSFGDWVQTIYTKKLDTYLNHGQRSGQNGIQSKLGMKSLDKYVFSDVMLGSLPLIASSIYLKHLVDKPDAKGDESDSDDSDESDREKEGIITIFGSQTHNSSLNTFSVFKSVMNSFGFEVHDTWNNDGDVSVPAYNQESYAWLDKIEFSHATNNWGTIKHGENDENFLKKIVDICSAYNRFVRLSEVVNDLGKKMNSMMNDVTKQINNLRTNLNRRNFTRDNVNSLDDLLDKLTGPKENLNALQKILINPCIVTLGSNKIKIPEPRELIQLAYSTDTTVAAAAQLAQIVQSHVSKPGRTSRRLITAVKIHKDMNENKDALKARASEAVQTNTQVLTQIYMQAKAIQNTFHHGGAAADMVELEQSHMNEFYLIQEPEPETCTTTAEYLFLIEIYAAYNACSMIAFDTCEFIYMVSDETVKSHATYVHEEPMELDDVIGAPPPTQAAEYRNMPDLNNNSILVPAKNVTRKIRKKKKRDEIYNFIRIFFNNYKGRKNVNVTYDMLNSYVVKKGNFKKKGKNLEKGVTDAVARLIKKEKVALQEDGSITVL